MVFKDEELENEGVWVYFFECLLGKIWIYGVVGKGVEGCIVVNRLFGCVFFKGWFVDSSGEVVLIKIWLYFEVILVSLLDEVVVYWFLL